MYHSPKGKNQAKEDVKLGIVAAGILVLHLVLVLCGLHYFQGDTPVMNM